VALWLSGQKWHVTFKPVSQKFPKYALYVFFLFFAGCIWQWCPGQWQIHRMERPWIQVAPWTRAPPTSDPLYPVLQIQFRYVKPLAFGSLCYYGLVCSKWHMALFNFRNGTMSTRGEEPSPCLVSARHLTGMLLLPIDKAEKHGWSLVPVREAVTRWPAPQVNESLSHCVHSSGLEPQFCPLQYL
jgi:hypothetical protein